MSSETRLRMTVVALLGVVAGCIGAAVGQKVPQIETPAIAVAHAQATATATPTGTPIQFPPPAGSGVPNVAAPLPPYPRQPKAPRWQQYCLESYQHNINKTLHAYGNEGWELVATDGSYRTCFRRPAP